MAQLGGRLPPAIDCINLASVCVVLCSAHSRVFATSLPGLQVTVACLQEGPQLSPAAAHCCTPYCCQASHTGWLLLQHKVHTWTIADIARRAVTLLSDGLLGACGWECVAVSQRGLGGWLQPGFPPMLRCGCHPCTLPVGHRLLLATAALLCAPALHLSIRGEFQG
jgi:hypothetical protein